MDREGVTSSNVESVGYDPETQTLEVEFKGGNVYQYAAVPGHVHQALMAAPSVGKYLGMHVKGKYRCERLDE
jgi:hypothetical protein